MTFANFMLSIVVNERIAIRSSLKLQGSIPRWLPNDEYRWTLCAHAPSLHYSITRQGVFLPRAEHTHL